MTITGWAVALAIALSLTAVGAAWGEWSEGRAPSEYTFDTSWSALRDVPERWPVPQRG